jgi:EAL domain-containing protein (putative c-di-GMP-specific phosphodiesterase class I)
VGQLVALGCTLAQGHHLSPPLGADQLDAVVTVPVRIDAPPVPR